MSEAPVPAIPSFSGSSLFNKLPSNEKPGNLSAKESEKIEEDPRENEEKLEVSMNTEKSTPVSKPLSSGFKLPSFSFSSLLSKNKSESESESEPVNDQKIDDIFQESTPGNSQNDTQGTTINSTALFDNSSENQVLQSVPSFNLNFGQSIFGKNQENSTSKVVDKESERNLKESIKLLEKKKQRTSILKDSKIDQIENEKRQLKSDFNEKEIEQDKSFIKSPIYKDSSESLIPRMPDFQNMFSKIKPKIVKLDSGYEFELQPKQNKSTLTTKRELKTDQTIGISINKIYQEMSLRQKHRENKSTAEIMRRKKASGPLWVEKYRPKSFLDLVGNEKANRMAMRWLRHWSTAVFGEDISKDLEKLNTKRIYYKKSNSVEDKKAKFGQSNVNYSEQTENKPLPDPYNRPTKRVLLLHGPPGIGKTTIAHLMAKHLGYDVMEINASDERSGYQVKEKIQSGLDNHTFSGNPTCIVADEIDGASDSGFIKIITDLLQKDSRATKNMIYTRSKKDKKKHKDKIILRPIIAICNDLYAPVLEKLRPHCEIIAFKKPEESQIKDRLNKICSIEKIPFNSKELNQVITVSNLDIRNCLNLLQFSGNNFINEDEDDNIQLRAKDSNFSWFKMVDLLFKLDLHDTKGEKFNKLQHHLQGIGSIEKVVNGCFQVYPQTVYSDPALIKKSNDLGDWLYFYDIMLNSKYQQNSDLSRYCNEVPLKFYSLFAEGKSTSKPKNYKINNSWDYFELQKINQDIIQKILINNNKMKPTLFTLLNKKEYCAIEFLPILNNFILNPRLVGNSNFHGPNGLTKENLILNHLINILQDFDFKIENVFNNLGIRNLAILPIMDSVTTFNNGISIDSKRQTLLKQLFFEIEKTRIAKAAQKRKLAVMDEKAITEKNRKEETQVDNDIRKSKMARNNGTVDFFKTSYDSMKHVKQKSEEVVEKSTELKVWVKYHEGFSNAVRKNVSWKELWN